jgi:Bacterial regulatory helix-turn-helix protein, lysR family
MLVKMNLDRFNLNLFVAFEALSKADTLTQAAGALYVTQSTLSVALRQMREYFDDELFVYKPKHKELTPLAQNLRPRVLEILKTAKATLMLKEEIARFDRTRCLSLVPDDSPCDIARDSRAAEEIPDEATYVEPESRALDRQDWSNDNAELYGANHRAISHAGSEDALFTPKVAGLAARGPLAEAKSQSHVQCRALKSRLLAELD